MKCIYNDCEIKAEGIIVVNDSRNDEMTVVMAPACRAHADQILDRGVLLQIKADGLTATGELINPDITLHYEELG